MGIAKILISDGGRPRPPKKPSAGKAGRSKDRGRTRLPRIFFAMRYNFKLIFINIINPALFLIYVVLVSSAAACAMDINSLKKEIENYIFAKKAVIGCALIDNKANIIAINNNIKFPLMSVYKLHQAIAVLKTLESSQYDLNSSFHITKDKLLENTYSPLRDRHKRADFDISINDLLKYSLQLSDNNACDILFEKIINPADTDKLVRSFGIEDFAISQTENDMHADLNNCYKNWTSPLALADLLHKLLHGCILSKYNTDILINMLIECKTGAGRLPEPLCDKVIIGHKTGTGDRNQRGEIIGLNDAGFVRLPNGIEYIIVVLIKDSLLSYAETEAVIARISALAYSYFSSANNF